MAIFVNTLPKRLCRSLADWFGFHEPGAGGGESVGRLGLDTGDMGVRRGSAASVLGKIKTSIDSGNLNEHK